jgi:hypothetical protein
MCAVFFRLPLPRKMCNSPEKCAIKQAVVYAFIAGQCSSKDFS